ncbi:MAG: hypothetical protein P4L84_19025 [Isosphaeraceae bacterium]|nr:hypothetical protein [Isosphaeraceae bacterium]
MICRSVRPIAVGLGLAVVSSAFWPVMAWGDGGTLRDWQRRGSLEIAVFTDPTPFVAGLVDISVLVLDAATGEPVSAADVMVELTPKDQSGPTTHHPATTDAATNKLLRAALFELPVPGRYAVNVIVARPGDRAQLQFDLDVARPSTPRAGVWPWILWPVPIIAVYGVHRLLVGRRAHKEGEKEEDLTTEHTERKPEKQREGNFTAEVAENAERKTGKREEF